MVRIASPIFIGRTAELATLDGALESAEHGRPTTVVIGGDAGVGKTRLLATWNDRAVESGARVVSGACLDLGESGPAYVAVTQAFRDLLGSIDPATLDGLTALDRATVGRLLPEFSKGAGAGSDDAEFTPTAQALLFNALVRVLELAGSDRPLVLELEDVHWADPSTRAFLLYLVANARATRLLIVATFRAEETARDHPITPVLLELERHQRATRIDLLPFDGDELEAQVLAMLGKPPTKRLMAAIRERSEGNALFAEELIASGDPTGELPTSVGAALLKRTAGLSPAARSVLRAAAVAGRSAPYDVLRLSTALDVDQLDAALHEAVDANILEAAHASERYRFRHALLQEAIYRDTLPGERRRLHASVAEAIEGTDEDSAGTTELVFELAYHWFEAKNRERALTASLAAGDTARRQSAYAEALHHYERVVSLASENTDIPTDPRLAVVLEHASRCAYLVGAPEKSVAYGERALDELGFADDRVLRVRVLDQVARAVHTVTDDALAYDRELGGIDLDGLPVREQLTVLHARVRALWWKSDLASATAVATEGVRLADESGDAGLKGKAHLLVAWNLMEGRDLEGSVREASVAESFASNARDAYTEVQAQRVICAAHTLAGAFEVAIDEARAVRGYADQVGLSRREGPWASYFEARALFELGRIAESTLVIEDALLEAPDGWALRLFHGLAAEVSVLRGQFDAAASHLEDARLPGATREKDDSLGFLAIGRAGLARAEGRLDDVQAIVDTTAQAIEPLRAFANAAEHVWPLAEIGLDAVATSIEMARAAADTRAVEAATNRRARIEAYLVAARRQRDASGVHAIGLLDGIEALIAGHLARIDDRDDPSLWDAAAAEFPPRSPRAFSARYRQAEAMLARRVSREEIRAVMADAHEIAVEIGAAPLARRFEALARRARIDLRPAAPVATSLDAVPVPDEVPAPGIAALRGRGLSDREIDVLTLVSAGFSNQAIGDRLFITDKTASVHVSHILAKLGASSRTEAATIGVRLGLPDVERDASD